MSLKKLVVALTRYRPRKRAEVMNYEQLFKGTAGIPTAIAHNILGLPSCSMVMMEKDTDAYFKEVFAGPVF